MSPVEGTVPKMGFYAEEIFTGSDFHLMLRASAIVSRLPGFIDGEHVRCHELARLVGHYLDLPVVDGKYGPMEHSWLFIPTSKKVLDVYVPASWPQVQLVDPAFIASPYRRVEKRDDIRWGVVIDLDTRLRKEGLPWASARPLDAAP